MIDSPFFIAEVSSNHNKDLGRCLRFIDEAANAGCGAVKFQMFQVEKLFAKEILMRSARHRERADWELPLDFIEPIYERCLANDIKLGCTPFYLEAVDELLPFVDFFKIASYELLWEDLIGRCARTEKPLILSTGMATLEEVRSSVRVAFDNGCADLSLLHCISSYPTPQSECNLRAIDTLRREFGVKVGWSDHTVSEVVLRRAIFKWNAEIVEFHLDLDGDGEEFQAGHCWLPNQIKDVLTEVRLGQTIDGDGKKKPAVSELVDRQWRADPVDGLRPLANIRGDFKE